MSVYNSAKETAFTKDDFATLHECVLLAMEIREKVGLDLRFKRNVQDREYLDELHASLKRISEQPRDRSASGAIMHSVVAPLLSPELSRR